MNKAIPDDCPFLVATDVLWLAKACNVTAGILHDEPLGARHQLRGPAASLLLAQLRHGVAYGALCELAAAHGVGVQQLHNLLGFLNTIGLLARSRTWQEWPSAGLRYARLLLLGARYQPLTWRRDASPASIIRAVLRATFPVVIAGCGTALLIIGGGFFAPAPTLAIAVYAGFVFVCSFIIHELAHLIVLGRQRVRSIVLCRGMRLGIVHRRLAIATERRVAIAGPLAGIASCVLAACVAQLADAQLAALISALVGVFHIGSLLPWYADGAVLFMTRKATPC